MSLIFLIGMPGAGKSYWGRQIAQNLVMPFNDLDKYIIQQEQSSIANLFKNHGEDWFRQKEHDYLEKLIAISKPNTVIACGGGTPCFHNNMELMNKTGITVYIKAQPENLLKNMHHSLAMRPLLAQNEDVQGYLTQLLAHRQPFYEQAQHILQTEYISLVIFEKIISQCTNRQ